MWSEFVRQRQDPNAFFICPIAYWTDADVWAFHRLRSLPYCELYDEGFKRLGCIGCPLAGPNMQSIEFARWPKYEQAWRLSFERFWERHSGTLSTRGPRKGLPRWFEDFGSAQGLWDWWRAGKGQGDGPQCQGGELFADSDMQGDGAGMRAEEGEVER